MVFIILFPAVAGLALFVILVIMTILKYGPKLCKVRHHALPDATQWAGKTYDHSIITYA